MANIPATLKYMISHEWLRFESDGTVTVGLTDPAQEALGDLVLVELPCLGIRLGAGEALASVESVTAAANLYTPVAGSVVAVNHEAVARPGKVNQDAYGVWLFRVAPDLPVDFDLLLDASAYRVVAETARSNWLWTGHHHQAEPCGLLQQSAELFLRHWSGKQVALA